MDIGSDLKNAVLSSKAKTLKAACYAGIHHVQMWGVAKRWFGTLEICDPGDEDIFLFDHPNDAVLPEYLHLHALQAIARGSHIFQFNPIEEHFVRRDKIWFEQPKRVYTEAWKYSLTEVKSDVKFGDAGQDETSGQG